jgi:Flp pilus assembly protein protease CpaA
MSLAMYVITSELSGDNGWTSRKLKAQTSITRGTALTLPGLASA